MTTFEEARRIVEAQLRETWTAEQGTLHVAPHGFEDDHGFLVVAGAREALVDQDYGFLPVGDPAFVVDKATGRLVLLSVLPNLDRLEAMTPCGPGIWSARRPGARLTWTVSGLDGDRDLRDYVEEYLATHDDVLVTPTGPSVPASMEESLAIYVLVAGQWPDAEFTGDLPDLTSLEEAPEGAVYSP